MARGEASFHGFGQSYIYGFDRWPDVATWDQSNGLAVTAEHGAVILTSEYSGKLNLTLDARVRRPAEADDPYGLTEGRAWDDIVEISLYCEQSPLVVEAQDQETDLPVMDTAGPGHYRLRVHARNRDVTTLDEEGFEQATDEYLIVSWPEPKRPSLSIRLTDQRGLGTRLGLLPPLDEDEPDP